MQTFCQFPQRFSLVGKTNFYCGQLRFVEGFFLGGKNHAVVDVPYTVHGNAQIRRALHIAAVGKGKIGDGNGGIGIATSVQKIDIRRLNKWQFQTGAFQSVFTLAQQCGVHHAFHLCALVQRGAFGNHSPYVYRRYGFFVHYGQGVRCLFACYCAAARQGGSKAATLKNKITVCAVSIGYNVYHFRCGVFHTHGGVYFRSEIGVDTVFGNVQANLRRTDEWGDFKLRRLRNGGRIQLSVELEGQIVRYNLSLRHIGQPDGSVAGNVQYSLRIGVVAHAQRAFRKQNGRYRVGGTELFVHHKSKIFHVCTAKHFHTFLAQIHLLSVGKVGHRLRNVGIGGNFQQYRKRSGVGVGFHFGIHRYHIKHAFGVGSDFVVLHTCVEIGVVVGAYHRGTVAVQKFYGGFAVKSNLALRRLVGIDEVFHTYRQHVGNVVFDGNTHVFRRLYFSHRFTTENSSILKMYISHNKPPQTFFDCSV